MLAELAILSSVISTKQNVDVDWTFFLSVAETGAVVVSTPMAKLSHNLLWKAGIFCAEATIIRRANDNLMQQQPLVFISVTCVPNHSTVDIHLLSVNPPVAWQVTVEELTFPSVEFVEWMKLKIKKVDGNFFFFQSVRIVFSSW